MRLSGLKAAAAATDDANPDDTVHVTPPVNGSGGPAQPANADDSQDWAQRAVQLLTARADRDLTEEFARGDAVAIRAEMAKGYSIFGLVGGGAAAYGDPRGSAATVARILRDELQIALTEYQWVHDKLSGTETSSAGSGHTGVSLKRQLGWAIDSLEKDLIKAKGRLAVALPGDHVEVIEAEVISFTRTERLSGPPREPDDTVHEQHAAADGLGEEINIGRDRRAPGPGAANPFGFPDSELPGAAAAAAARARDGIAPGTAAAAAGAAYGTGSGIGSTIGSLVGGTLGAVDGVLRSAVAGTSSVITRSFARTSAKRERDRVAMAEASVADAEIAATSVVRAAEVLRSNHDFKDLYAAMTDAARQNGRSISQVAREMRPGGRFADLEHRFKQLREENSMVRRLYDNVALAIAENDRKWTEAARAVNSAKGDHHPLWDRATRATRTIQDATQGLPGDPGETLADRAKKMLDALGDLLRRLFRLGPSVAQQARPAAPAA